MWGKIPERQTRRPLGGWCQTGRSAQGILVPFIGAIFVPRPKICAFGPLRYGCRRVGSISASSVVLQSAAPVVSCSRHEWLSCNVQ